MQEQNSRYVTAKTATDMLDAEMQMAEMESIVSEKSLPSVKSQKVSLSGYS